VGVTSFFIACKYFEVKKLSINFFRGITANAFDLDAIRHMELTILKMVCPHVCVTVFPRVLCIFPRF
jgi:hypothetical protein